ncbi:hypothetical protein Tco_1144061 [Tanacetum coccineum]
MIIKKDSEIVKEKVERKSLTLKATKESSDEECSTSESEDEEYAMAKRLQGKNGGDPNHLIRECPKPPKDKNQTAFVRGSWSDSSDEDDEKVNNETCLVAQDSSNQKLFSSYKEYNGGNVAFGSNLRGNIISKDALNDEEVFVAKQEVANEKDNDGEITLAQALLEMKSTKPKDKGKGIMIEEPVKPMKKKHQISFDEEVALKLQAEFDEEERLSREKAEKEKEANIALTEEGDDIQAKIEADHELAQRLQAEEQEELSDAKKATLFQQLLEKKRNHFAAKRAEEQRNKPPTQA